MKFGMEVDLRPDHVVLDGGTASPANFSAHVCCGQMVAHLSYQ